MIFVEKGIEQIFKNMEMVPKVMCLEDLDFEVTISGKNEICVMKGNEVQGIEGTNFEAKGQTLIFEASSLGKQGTEAKICEANSLE